MKSVYAIIAFGALAHAATVQAAGPAFMKLGDIKGEAAKPQSEQGAAASSGVSVAAGDINGDGTTGLLVPAVQRAPAAAPKPEPRVTTSSQGPYQLTAPASAPSAPAKPKPKPVTKSKKPASAPPAGESISLN